MGWWKSILLGAAVTSLAACHTRPPDAEEGITGGVAEGVLAPLEDFNVRREEIPPVLATLDVYDKQVPTSCEGLELEIRVLEGFVGSDVDAVDLTSERLSLRGQVINLMDDQTYNLVSDFTRDFIPFRSMVRRATGATAHDRAIREAYRKGHLRRSYLKGIGFAMGCDSPAAPHFPKAVASRRELEREAEATTFTILEVPPAW